MGKLFRTLDGIVSLVLAGTACSSAASSADGGTPDEASFTCKSPLPPILSNLRPAMPVDYVEIRKVGFRRQVDDDAGADAGALPVTAGETNGTPCASAANHDACMKALADLTIAPQEGWNDTPASGMTEPAPTYTLSFLAYTRGDEVGAAKSKPELASFLGTIDTLEEVRLLLAAQSTTIDCGSAFKSGWRHNGDGSWDLLIGYSNCGTNYQRHVTITADGKTIEGELKHDNPQSICGRRPAGLVVRAARGASIGEWLAEAAHLEAASVHAFRRLERELRSLGAPATLVRAAAHARCDEVRHARVLGAFARRRGSEPARVVIEGERPRSVFAIALENAVEGGVRETFGALVAAYQARRASDPALRAAFARIARDEARHAELAQAVATWLEPRLTPNERTRIAAAREKALEELRTSVQIAPASEVEDLAGVPRPHAAQTLLGALEQRVLRAA